LAGKKQLIIADSTLTQPNGITGTPDGKYLYVADIGKWKTYRFNIQPGGSLTNKQLFADEGSDGMTIDDAGNIYLTNNGVSIYDSSGKKIEHIDVPEKWTANVCFGGKNKNILFITASKSVYIIQTTVKGVE
jgi:gluconolactonase